jgi:putative transposase
VVPELRIDRRGRAFCALFFGYYHNEHRHSGIGLRTPQSVHDGT